MMAKRAPPAMAVESGGRPGWVSGSGAVAGDGAVEATSTAPNGSVAPRASSNTASHNRRSRFMGAL